jgi:hypothetical protein
MYLDVEAVVRYRLMFFFCFWSSFFLLSSLPLLLASITYLLLLHATVIVLSMISSRKADVEARRSSRSAHGWSLAKGTTSVPTVMSIYVKVIS